MVDAASELSGAIPDCHADSDLIRKYLSRLKAASSAGCSAFLYPRRGILTDCAVQRIFPALTPSWSA